MGYTYFVAVAEGSTAWQFEVDAVLEQLATSFSRCEPGLSSSEGRITYADVWVGDVSARLQVAAPDNLVTVEGVPEVAAELVAWLRGQVPPEVRLEVFDEGFTYGLRDLPPGVSAADAKALLFAADHTSEG